MNAASGNELRKAAVVLMSLPEEEAAQILAKLDSKQVEQVSIEIARIGAVSGDEQQEVIKHFADANPNALIGESGGLDVAKRLVEKAFGKSAGGTLDNVRQQIEALPFAFLQRVDSQNLLTFLIDEHPQTIALILTHVPASRAAEILKGLPQDRQLSVIRRIATMGQTNPEVIQQVERGLEKRMASVMSQSFEKAGGVESVAGILNVSDRATERMLLENLAQDDPALVEDIRRLMFVFEDLNKFSAKDIQTVLKNVETSQWALALKGASDELKEKILANMSSRAAEMLREEMGYLGQVRLSAVEQTQQQIVDVVRRLEDTGELILHADEADDQFVS
ncbi:MAG: flagellar motor switch protein FliG [Pirellulales bacterium]|nr:flagellar motor switch protein FliG [Pirellulales bacterium]